MRRLLYGTTSGLVLLLLVFMWQLPLGLAQTTGNSAQQQTIDAIAIERINASATARAIQGVQTLTGEEVSLTLTAEFELTIAKRIDEILTATAQQGAGSAVIARLNGNQSANLRACPGTDCDIVTTIAPAADFSILAVTGEWYEIALEDGVRGFVFSELVNVEDASRLALLPTPMPTATPTPLPTSTPDVSITATFEAFGALASPKSDGYYIVGVDILAGRWESQGEAGGCYWERLDRAGDIHDNHYGDAGGTITIRPTDFAINLEDCGLIEYVETRPKELEASAYDTKGDGFYTVGIEIAPGMWRSNGQGGGCYWARLDRFQEINDNHYGNAGVAVYVNAADYEVNFSDCGEFEYIGP